MPVPPDMETRHGTAIYLPCGEDSQVDNQMVGGILTAHTIMWPTAKGQEVALEFDVLPTLLAEAVRVKLVWLCECLQEMFGG